MGLQRVGHDWAIKCITNVSQNNICTDVNINIILEQRYRILDPEKTIVNVFQIIMQILAYMQTLIDIKAAKSIVLRKTVLLILVLFLFWGEITTFNYFIIGSK